LDTIIAVDLGSNSFHLLEAYWGSGELIQVRALQRRVQLSLDMVAGELTDQAIRRGLDSLADFACYTFDKPQSRVCIVATQALRVASNRDRFCRPAEALLGHPIDIISGEREAELVYRAVRRELILGSRQLIIDIGGGSTEFALGSGPLPEHCFSLPIGCVSLLQYFPGGAISVEGFAGARGQASASIKPIVPVLGVVQGAIGCSGTLLAIEAVLVQLGGPPGQISRQGLLALSERLTDLGHLDEVQFEGLSADRRGVFVPGVAIALGIFDSFAIESLSLSSWALREGVALDVITG